MHATRIADIKALNKQRWDEQVAASADGASAPASTPTGGALFNRPNPLNGDHSKFVEPYVRSSDRFLEMRGEARFLGPDGEMRSFAKEKRERIVQNWRDNELNPRKYVPVYGHDFTSVRVDSRRKYRIPGTSVVNKVGDCKLFCCCGWRLTAVRTTRMRTPHPPASTTSRVRRRNGSGSSTSPASWRTRPWCS